MHPCQNPSVVLNQSPVLSVNKSVLLPLLYRFSMLYLFIVANRSTCQTLKIYEDVILVFLILQVHVLLVEDSHVEYMLWCAPICSETDLLRNDHDFACSVVLAKLQVYFLHETTVKFI